MRKRFNITGSCKPQKHYMVNLSDRIKRIKEEYVDEGCYFVINRGRQYGKTTTLQLLSKYLAKEYIVFSLDFQKMAAKKFTDEITFSNGFVEKLLIALKDADTDAENWIKEQLLDFKNSHIDFEMDELFIFLSSLCEASPLPIVLIIDEVDSASNNQVFLDFLAQLRGYYLEREETPIFHSVILAGVYDIKNLKLKLRPESEHQYNSPWNIAAKFKIEMHFSAEQIAGMLEEYEADYQTGMDIQAVAEEIFAYTSGYPVLVSSICKCIDEELLEEKEYEYSQKAWTKQGVAKAVKNILKESTPLFESMVKQLEFYKDLQAIIEGILYRGMRIPFEVDVKPINIGKMFGFLKEVNGQVAIANRIFEMKLLNIFITKEALNSASYRYGEGNSNQFIKDGKLNMPLVLEKFVIHFQEVYGKNNEKFVEDYGRKFFLLYLKPIINGTGNYYLEAQTRDARRTDVIIDYLGEQFIVELKIWHGNEYNERGEQQLLDYLDYYHKDKGYLLSFNFNKKKETGVKEIRIRDKTIIEAVV